MTIGSSSLADVSLQISQGSTNRYAFLYSKMVSGVKTPVNLTGHSVKSQIRDRVGGSILLQLDSYITLGEDGSVVVVIPATVTEGAEWSSRSLWLWDMELTETSSGTVVRFVSGTVSISPDITRAI